MKDTNCTYDAFIESCKDCVSAFSVSVGLGCTIANKDGNILSQAGFSCDMCAMCKLLGIDDAQCKSSHNYGLLQSQRLSGQYIYFCPMGLTCLVSPIETCDDEVFRFTVGPLLMGDEDDFVSYDLVQKFELSAEKLVQSLDLLKKIPKVPPARVNKLSDMLYISAKYITDQIECVSDVDDDVKQPVAVTYRRRPQTPYPLSMEKQLLQNITQGNKEQSQKLLNEILGYILLPREIDINQLKSRTYGLIVLMSRAAIDGGADPEGTLLLNNDYLREIQNIEYTDELYSWLADVMNEFMNNMFSFGQIKHLDVIHKAIQYIREHYNEKVTLEKVAYAACLSPSYFSKIFKEETGTSFNNYLNNLRVEKSKPLLLNNDYRIVDIALAVGFEDQSYYTKVFKRTTGVSPNKYREAKGRIQQ